MKHQRYLVRACVLALVVLLVNSVVRTQTTVYGNLSQRIDGLVAAMPSSGSASKYRIPTGPEQAQWSSVILAILEGHLSDANTSANGLGYHLLIFVDTTTTPPRQYDLLEEEPGSSRYWGTFIYNLQPSRPTLFIQSPHPLYDSNTGKQGYYIFKRNEALAFYMTGAHRCNNDTLSPCSGTTTACSASSEPYRVSDQAHSVEGMLQKTTEVLNDHVAGLVVLQNHGFAKQASDPDLIMSNGTTSTPAEDKLLALRDHLAGIDTVLTFKVAHIDIGWTRLIATTNVQGRLLNGSPNICSQNAPSASGRFIHIEQAYARLRDSQQNWDKLASAVGLTFDPVSSVEHPAGTSQAPPEFTLLRNFPNPFNAQTTVEYVVPASGWITMDLYTALGERIRTLASGERAPGTYRLSLDMGASASGLYFIRFVGQSFVSTRPIVLLK